MLIDGYSWTFNITINYLYANNSAGVVIVYQRLTRTSPLAHKNNILAIYWWRYSSVGLLPAH